MMCIFSIDLLIIQIVLFVFNETQQSETGMLLVVAMSILSIPLGIKAGEVANHYAVPIICGVNLMSCMDIALQIFQVQNKYNVKAVLELISFATGFYFG